jgi:hypothetical protein
VLAAAPVAPAAPLAGITAALILVSFALVALYGLQYGYQYTLGAFVRRLADMVEDIWLVGGRLADALDRMDAWVMQQIGNGIASLDAASARLWAGLTWVVREWADATAAAFADVEAAIRGLVVGEIPQQVERRTTVIREKAASDRAWTRTRLEEEARARSRGIDRLTRDLAAERLARERGIDRLAGRLEGLVLPRIRAVEAGLSDVAGYTRRTLARRLSRLEQLVLGGALAAAATAALTARFPWWQCTNVRAFNRFLCRYPARDLSGLLALLAGSALLAVALDPRLLARSAQALTAGLEGVIRETALR